jgi:hypothetical protein
VPPPSPPTTKSAKAFATPCLPHTPDHDSSLLPAASTTPQSEEARHCPKHYLSTTGKKPQAPQTHHQGDTGPDSLSREEGSSSHLVTASPEHKIHPTPPTPSQGPEQAEPTAATAVATRWPQPPRCTTLRSPPPPPLPTHQSPLPTPPVEPMKP